MNLAHDFRALTPQDSGYHWRRRGRRCRYCSVDEDHIFVDLCEVLVARARTASAPTTALEECADAR